jgi:hypothetical protein
MKPSSLLVAQVVAGGKRPAMNRRFVSRTALQRGIVLPLVAISLAVLIGMAGLALDLGHAYVNKTRLQNALDAAALSGAYTLNITRDTAQASASARDTFDRDIGGSGNQELDAAGSGSDLTVEFSDILFNPADADAPQFVRVRLTNFILPTWFVHVLPGVSNTLTVGASAVAGATPIGNGQICNIAPMMPCGDPNKAPSAGCPDCFYGYTKGQSVTLKTGSRSEGWEVGPGNYQLIQLDCGPGGACVRENMAGSYDQCWTVTDTVTTKPGDTVGPTAQGLCTRFGDVPGCHCVAGLDCANTYKPDWVTDAGPSGYPDTLEQYQNDYVYQSWDHPDPQGEPERRVIVLPIGNCTGTINGQGDVPVLGFGCFLLTQPPEHTGSQEIYGAFIGDCNAKGTPGLNPGTGPGPYVIQLYKDPASRDS